MGKKKSSSGKNKTPRKAVQMPTDWLGIARDRAKAARQPTLWYLIALIQKDAQEAGVANLPLPPWDKEAGNPGPSSQSTDQ